MASQDHELHRDGSREETSTGLWAMDKITNLFIEMGQTIPDHDASHCDEGSQGRMKDANSSQRSLHSLGASGNLQRNGGSLEGVQFSSERKVNLNVLK